MRILQMSFSGAILILVIVVIRAIGINKLPKRTFLVLWEIVLIRLLVPFSIPSIFSVYSFINRNTSAKVFSGMAEINTFHVMLPGQISAIQGMQQSSVNRTAPISTWFVIWCIGMMFLMAFFTISYLHCRFDFQTSIPVHNDFVEQWIKEHPTKRVISIRQSGKFSAPLTYGIFRPVILMPKKTDWENTEQLKYVFLHEYIHVRRYDTVKKLIMVFALCVHWFNPLVWCMYILFNRDIELACDESVVRCFGENTKSTYALMLISMEAEKSGLTPFCNNFSKNAIEERITAIMKMKKVTALSCMLTCLIVASTATVFATSADLTNSQKMTDKEMTEIALQRVEKSYPGEAEWLRKCYPDTVWWTYEGYKQMMDTEREELESMIGECIGWTPSTGDIIVTSEMIEQQMAEYEEVLTQLQNGWMVTKSVGGDENQGGGYNPAWHATTSYGYEVSITLLDGKETHFGPYNAPEELLAEVEPFCKEQVKNGNMEQDEMDELISKYSNITE